jgi:hypothetical protein
VRSAVLALLPFVIAGCSSAGAEAPGPADSGAGDAPREVVAPDVPEAGMAYPAPHSPMPQAINLGGPVMTVPKIVAVTFPGDALAPNISQLIAAFGKPTSYWAGATAEYGVGPVVSTKTVASTYFPPKTLSDSAIKAWLASQLGAPSADAGGGWSGLPTPDGDTEYVLFYPDTVTIGVPGGLSCQQFLGYHDDFALNGGYVSYSVIPRCPAPGPDISAIDSLAMVVSHEVVEMAVDPLPTDNPAWFTVDADHLGWTLIAGPEIGDLCAAFPDSFYRPADLPYLVQRVWSNRAAAAGHDPCEPEGSSPYFNAAPVLGDTIAVGADRMGFPATTKGVTIPVGQSKTVELDLFTDQPASGPVTVQAIDLDRQYLGPAELSFAFDKTTGRNGDKLQLTITVVGAGIGNVEPFWLQATLGVNQAVWIGLVGN